MVCWLLIISPLVNLASIASISRLTWACARDGALPEFFAYINRSHNVPVRAVWLLSAIVMVLVCLNIADSAAFGAFTALGTIGLFASYFLAIGYLVQNRLSRNPAPLGH
ncbi:hypothetical protein N7474_001734 [Penicillium riverlandense]|uniref:uncharacterized protein n=1 Tax=Penicillium riverlandense TaxID=1903569 RepID=UPI002548185E|nr:uncharacterized protein N7474_001734 [Penicillium riverlandense]KAJ5833423.1 hypothetical protein N7474_001734 [Penicillium riverlandense]